MQSARARIQIQYVGQTDHSGQAPGEVLPRERRGANDWRRRKRLKRGVGLRLIGRMWGNEDSGLGLRGRARGNGRGGRMRLDNPHSDQN